MKTLNLFKKITLLLIIGVVVFGLSSCNNSAKKKVDDRIKVGVIFPLTGNLSFYGELCKNSLAMTIDTSKVDLIMEDSKGEIKDAITILNKFISVDKIDVLVSFLPPICEALNPIVEKNKLLHFAFTQSPAIANNNYTIKFWACSKGEAETFIKYIKQVKPKKIAFSRHLYPDADLAFRTITKPFVEEKNIEYIDIPFDLDTKDFKNYAVKIKSFNPGLVITQTLAFNYKNIISAYKDMGLLNKMICDLNYYNVKDLNDFKDKSFENIPFVNMSLVTSDTYNKYTNEYKSSFNKETTVFGVFAYDLGLVLNKLYKTSLQKKGIIDFYNKNDIEGVSGRIVFDTIGNLELKYDIAMFKDGKIVDYK